MDEPFLADQVRAILLDIEGTTTPVEFAHDVLFPYVRRHVLEFVQRHHAREEVRRDLEDLRREHARDVARRIYNRPWRDELPGLLAESASAYVHWLMDRDRKLPPLKDLQGRIWEAGFRGGELRGALYPDVLPALRRWNAQGRDVCVFSSGSVQAQRLIFGHSVAGDLTGLLRAHFDTLTGAKKEADSYRRIAGFLGRSPKQIVFLSDAVSELDAARDAGLKTLLCVRTGGEETLSGGHRMIHGFDAVFPGAD